MPWMLAFFLSDDFGVFGWFSDGFRQGVAVFCRPVGWSGADLEVQNRFIGDLGWDFWLPNRFAGGF